MRITISRFIYIFAFNILFSFAHGIELYDAKFADGELIIPIISAEDKDYEVRMLLDSGSDLSSIGCSGYCFKLVYGDLSKVLAPPIYPNFLNNVATIQRLWFEDKIYEIALEYKGEYGGYLYFQLNSADLKKSIFSETPIVLRNPEEYYTEACNRYQTADKYPSIQFVIPVDINDDNQKDFIAHYWCDISNDYKGVLVENPTPDVLVTFISNSDGSYYTEGANESVFGERYPSLGGASRKYVRADFNNDGFDDFAFAMNWEDGRAQGTKSEIPTNATEPSILLSNGKGKYVIDRLGSRSWGHSVASIANSVGGEDAIFAGFTQPNLQAFRYVNSNLVNVTDLYLDEKISAGNWTGNVRATPEVINNGASKFIIGDVYNQDGATLGIWENINGVFELTSTSSISTSFFVKTINYAYSLNSSPVYEIYGRQFLGIGFDESCIIKNLFTAGDYYAIVKISAFSPTKETGKLVEGNTYIQGSDLRPVQKLLFYKIQNGNLESIPWIIQDEIELVNSNFMLCDDVNNDGYSDLVVEVLSASWGDNFDIGGQPLIYLNDKKGHLVKIGTENYPTIDNGNSQGYLFDIDTDGLSDLVLFPQKVSQWGDDNNIYIYKAKQLIGE